MIPAGYMFKVLIPKQPFWDNADHVTDIYSVSNCLCKEFDEDYIDQWKHNGYWFFDSPEIMREIAEDKGIDLSGMTLFYYEMYEAEFIEESKSWSPFSPEPSFPLNVEPPVEAHLEGYDVVTYWDRSPPGCSPLSCNGVAAKAPVNPRCLFNTFEEAKRGLESGLFDNSEPGPFRIIAVYTAQGVQFEDWWLGRILRRSRNRLRRVFSSFPPWRPLRNIEGNEKQVILTHP